MAGIKEGEAAPILRNSLLRPAKTQMAVMPEGPPILIVAVDTEAEFDWSGPFRRTDTGVGNLRNQLMAQEIFDRWTVRPIYLVDYAVATQPAGYEPLLEISKSARCEIGAHLHPWITPPFTEELSNSASFSHNLPVFLQKAKLQELTRAIRTSFGVQPKAYRAGRYGIGEEATQILHELGYSIDMSVRPNTDMRRIQGPDFRSAFDRPYWFGSRLLEIPLTICLTGILAQSPLPKRFGMHLYQLISHPTLDRLHVRGLLLRTNLLEQLPLTPEGVTLRELRRLTFALLARGHRVFVLSYHSSSLLPGSNDYVGSDDELRLFLDRIDKYIAFFFEEVGGISLTPSQLLARLHDPAPASITNVNATAKVL